MPLPLKYRCRLCGKFVAKTFSTADEERHPQCECGNSTKFDVFVDGVQIWRYETCSVCGAEFVVPKNSKRLQEYFCGTCVDKLFVAEAVCVFDERERDCGECGGTITCPQCGSAEKTLVQAYETKQFYICNKCGTKYSNFIS